MRRAANHEASPSSVSDLVMVWRAVSARRPATHSNLRVLKAKATTILPLVGFCLSPARLDTGIFAEDRSTDKVDTKMRAEATAASKGMFNGSAHITVVLLAQAISILPNETIARHTVEKTYPTEPRAERPMYAWPLVVLTAGTAVPQICC